MRCVAAVLLIFLAAGCNPVGQGEDTRLVSRLTPEKIDGKFVLRRANGAEPETLDPHRAQSANAANIIRDLYEGLVGAEPDGRLSPAAAQSWEVSADGKTYTFHLRPNARWSNGEAVTASDFVYGLRRCVDPATGSAYAEILKPIQNAEEIVAGKLKPDALAAQAANDHTLIVQLKAPTPYFLGMLAHTSSFPAWRKSIEAHGDQFTRPGKHVTNGAYRIKEWVTSSYILIERNPYYWDNVNTRLDYVRYLPIENTDSEFKRYLSGEVDWTGGVPIPRLEAVRKQLKDQFYMFPTLGVYYYGLNTERAPFKGNTKLRQALTLAIDRKILVEKVTRGGEIPAYAWVPPGVHNYEQQRVVWAEWPRDKQLAEARRLYQESGYANDEPLELRYNTLEAHKKIAVAIAYMWKQALGVKVRLINEEWKVFLQNVQYKKVTQVYRLGWFGDYDDANTFMELMYSRFGLNGTGYQSAEYDALVDKASYEADPAYRRKLLQAAERQLLNDLPIIPLYHYVNKHLMKPYVKGYAGNVLDHHYSKNLWIEWPLRAHSQELLSPPPEGGDTGEGA
ncbi:MAG: peptide ABC transporter substrate-binding protein [Nevskiales bacterium]